MPRHDGGREDPGRAAVAYPGDVELLAKLVMVVGEVSDVLRTVNPSELSEHMTIQGFHVTRLGALMHTVPHFVGHTHQITQLTRQQLGADYTMQWSPDDHRDRIPL